MEIKLTIELKHPKDADYYLVLAEAEEVYRPRVEQLKDTGSKIGHSLVSTHSDWSIDINESEWDCDFLGDIWHCDISIFLEIAELNSGDIVDEYLAWELQGEPLDRQVFEPLHSCDWSGLQDRKGIDLQFSSLKAVPNNNGEGLFFHYDVS